MNSGGIYVHIPFCRNKCLYCDFYSAGSRIADWNHYTTCIINELESRLKEINFIPNTLYFGGGTPSLIPAESFRELCSSINRLLTNKNNWVEFTIEANPEDINEEKCQVWKEAGVDRVSLGIQSMNNNELSAIGRKTTSENNESAVKTLALFFNNISVDIMFGLPSQTIDSYLNTLDNIIGLNPQHISSYSLMLEKGTAMTHLAEKGKIILPDEESWIKMFHLTSSELQKAGFERYEFSNFSKKGFRSKHNTNYWNGLPYIGLGCGAHSYDGFNIRRWNPTDLKAYLRFFSKEETRDNFSATHSYFFEEEVLGIKEIKEEMIMTRLRMKQGLNLKEFDDKFGRQERQLLLKKADPYLKNKLLKEEAGFLYLTDDGIIVSDSVISGLF